MSSTLSRRPQNRICNISLCAFKSIPNFGKDRSCKWRIESLYFVMAPNWTHNMNCPIKIGIVMSHGGDRGDSCPWIGVSETCPHSDSSSCGLKLWAVPFPITAEESETQKVFRPFCPQNSFRWRRHSSQLKAGGYDIHRSNGKQASSRIDHGFVQRWW